MVGTLKWVWLPFQSQWLWFNCNMSVSMHGGWSCNHEWGFNTIISVSHFRVSHWLRHGNCCINKLHSFQSRWPWLKAGTVVTRPMPADWRPPPTHSRSSSSSPASLISSETLTLAARYDNVTESPVIEASWCSTHNMLPYGIITVRPQTLSHT